MSETFKTNWRGWARSSEGYAVRLMGRNDLQYRDELGELSIFVEPMAGWKDIVVDLTTVTDLPERSPDVLLSRLRRAFEFRGWSLIRSDGGPSRSSHDLDEGGLRGHTQPNGGASCALRLEEPFALQLIEDESDSRIADSG